MKGASSWERDHLSSDGTYDADTWGPTGREHELKCWPTFFGDVLSGVKPFEVRRDDRDFRVGDDLWLREWDALDGYSGREMVKRVTYVLLGDQFGIEVGYCVLGLGAL